jgi:hypothetical protein
MVKSTIAKKFVINESTIKSVPDYVLQYLELQNHVQTINALKSSVETWMKKEDVNQILINTNNPDIANKYGSDSFVSYIETKPQIRNSFNEEICGFVFQQWLIRHGFPSDKLTHALQDFINMVKQENKRRFDLNHKHISTRSRISYGKSASRAMGKAIVNLAKWDDE